MLSELPASKEKYEDVTTALSAHFRPKKNKWAKDTGSGSEPRRKMNFRCIYCRIEIPEPFW